jgi:hypothetical protein
MSCFALCSRAALVALPRLSGGLLLLLRPARK